MFEEDTYEHLAELYVKLENCASKDYLYCLCSRSILKSDIYDEERVLAEINDNSNNEEIGTISFLNSSTESQPSAVHVIKKKEQDEGISCYCSASHCSTDDSTKDAPHSDSGADLSEASREPGWEDYWRQHGDSIIWKSWIEKYGDYVDPNYTIENKQTSGIALENYEPPEVSQEHSDLTRWSFGSEISDSFTNITPLTLSEVSTEDSSLLSSSDSAGSASIDSTLWQTLWINHFNIQYQLAFENYQYKLENQAEQIKDLKKLSDDESLQIYMIEENVAKLSNATSKKRCKNVKSELQFNSVGSLLHHLRSIQMDQEASHDNLASDAPEEISSKITINAGHNEPMIQSSSEFKNQSTSDLRAKLKRPHDREDDRLRSAFNLIGLTYQGEGVSSGSVTYKKRNIRWQNRLLNMNVHLRFDDDGQVILKDKKTDKKVDDDDDDENWHLANTCEIKSDFSEKDDSSDGEFYSASEESESKKERKKKRKRRKVPKEILDNDRLIKYWYQRYRLFSKFDEGIKLDEESWYSVTPEKIAQFTAERCRCDIIVDAFCGAGGNAIQFAFTCERVIAIDIDPQKIEMARHNATIYGVQDRIEFIVGDYMKLAPYLQADVIYLSPPWGGLDYFSRHSYNLDRILPPIGGSTLFAISSKITPNIAMYLPRNVNTDELLHLAGPDGYVEIEQNFLQKKLVAVTSYFGELVGSYSQSEIRD